MLIGNKNRFAVEYELDELSGEEWMFGKICYWIENKAIGEYEIGTSLRDVLFQLKYLIFDCGNRNGGDICSQLPIDIFNKLNESIYRGFENTLNNAPDSPARFDVSIHVDVFDDWKIFLIDCANKSVITFKKHNETEVNFFYLDKGEFDSVIKSLDVQLGKIYDQFKTE